jgi:hypothetical protein
MSRRILIVTFSQMNARRKITVRVPSQLLARAQKHTGTSVSETVRKGLELLAAAEAYEGLRRLRGKVKLSFGVDQLR